MNYKKRFLIVAIILSFNSIFSQATYDFGLMNRGKLWATVWNSGAVGYPVDPQSLFGYFYEYPGYEKVGTYDDANQLIQVQGYAVMATVGGINEHFSYYNVAYPPADWMSIKTPSNLVENFNMADPTLPGELVLTGGHYLRKKSSDPSVAGNIYLEVDMRSIQMSYPDLDDFIIHEYTLTNPANSEQEITDMYFSPRIGWQISTKGYELGPGGNYDDKYGWFEDERAFYFYDDRSFNFTTGDETQFNIGPGVSKGDKGDASDIQEGASSTSELLAPQYASLVMIDSADAPVYHNIVSRATQNGTFFPQDGGDRVDESVVLLWKDWETRMRELLTYDQPKGSWDELNAAGEAAGIIGTGGGSKWERAPEIFVSSGPHSISPGESVTLVYAVVVGEMDRSKIVEGGEANIDLLDIEGPAALKQNIQNAKSFYNAGYKWDNPSPTIDNITRTPVGGGIELSWIPISSNYIDPTTGEADFAGYKVYNSNYFATGPWTMIADIPKGSETVRNDSVIFTETGMPLGVGAYYVVTSYDSDGNESGKVSPNRFPVYPMMAPNNNFPDDRPHVVPNPFRVQSGLLGSGEELRLNFINLPSKGTIRIYTLAGDLVKTIEHDDGSGSVSWGSIQTQDYQTNDWLLYIQPGFYLYHITSDVDGKEFTGKFAIIK